MHTFSNKFLSKQSMDLIETAMPCRSMNTAGSVLVRLLYQVCEY